MVGLLWDPVHIGGLELQLSPTKHVVMLLLAATLASLILIGTARAHTRHTHAVGRPKGRRPEAMVLYIRNEVIMKHRPARRRACALPVDGVLLPPVRQLARPHPVRLPPYGNVSVTATMAILSLLVTEISGIRAQGAGYLNTIFY